jgi:hypothetical protein
MDWKHISSIKIPDSIEFVFMVLELFAEMLLYF